LSKKVQLAGALDQLAERMRSDSRGLLLATYSHEPVLAAKIESSYRSALADFTKALAGASALTESPGQLTGARQIADLLSLENVGQGIFIVRQRRQFLRLNLFGRFGIACRTKDLKAAEFPLPRGYVSPQSAQASVFALPNR
jgi:hypothetical protein